MSKAKSFFDGALSVFGGVPSGVSSGVANKVIESAPVGGVFSLGAGAGSLPRGSSQLIATYNTSPNVRKVVGLIANSLSAIPFYLRKRRGTAKKSWPSVVRSMTDKAARAKATSGSDEIWEHPFLDFLYRGSPEIPGPQGLKASYVYREVKGEFFWLLVPGENGKPVMWVPLSPTSIHELPSAEAKYYKIVTGGKATRAPEELIFYHRDLDVANLDGRGRGVGDSLTDELDSDEYAASLLRVILANRAFSDVIIGIKAANGAAVGDVAELLEAKYNQRHRGSENAGRAIVVPEADVTVRPLTHSLGELRLLELRQWEADFIRQTWGVPPELLGQVQNSNRATIESAEALYSQYVLMPRLESMRLELQLKLLPMFDPRGEYVVEYVEPSVEDKERNLRVMQAMPQAFTLNEWRMQAGKGEVPWGNNRPQQMAWVEIPASGAANKSMKTKATDAANLTRVEIDVLLMEIDSSELAEKLSGDYATEMRKVAKRQFDAFPGAVGDFALVNPLIKDYADRFAAQWVTGVDAVTKENLARSLATGLDSGESISELAKRVSNEMGYLSDGYRNELIARTESVRATNAAREMGWEATELPLEKEWISALSPDTRESHAALHGTTVKVSEEFTFDGSLEPYVEESVLMPANSTSAAHACNCQCTAVAFDPEVGKAMTVYGSEMHRALCKEFDDEADDIAKRTRADMNRFYRKMEVRLLDKLKRMG